MPMNLLSARDRLRIEREERATARLQCRCQSDQKQRSEQTEVRQARLDRRCVHKAAEQPTARQTRLATDHPRTHECRAVEHPEARQAKLEIERLRERNIKLKMLGFA